MTTTPLPSPDGRLFLTDAGCETDLIYNRGVPVPEFAAHTLLADPVGRAALADYYRGFLDLARATGSGMVLDAPTWKAHPFWAADLGVTNDELHDAVRVTVAFSRGLADEYADVPVLVDGLVGPRGDAYAPDSLLTADEAEAYHATQIGWLAEAGVDLVTALTFTHTDEAIGAVRAARTIGVPIVVSFTVETDGRLPTGEPLGEAVQRLDGATGGAAAYVMVNCAHPDHVLLGLTTGTWIERVRGVRCNASRQSHAELDVAEVLDDGDPAEFADGYVLLASRLPALAVVGGCCGSDLRHVTAVARKLTLVRSSV